MSDGCCDRTAAALRAGRTPPPSDCPGCQALVAARPPLPEPAELDVRAAFAGLEAALAEEGWRGRLRAWPTWARLTAVLGALALVGLANAVLAPRPDLGGLPLGRLLGILALLGAGAWAAARGGLWPLQRPPLDSRWALGLVLLGLAIPLALALGPQAPATHAACTPPAAMFTQKAFGCLIYGCLCAAPALGLGVIFARGTLSLLDGLLLAAAGALCGQVGLQLHCPITDGTHQLAGHVPVPVLLGGVVCVALGVLDRRR